MLAIVSRDRNVTHDPLIGLARAIRRQQPVRILLRSFSEQAPNETIEGFVLRFEGDGERPSRVVFSTDRPGSGEITERLVRVDRVAMVEMLASADATLESEPEETGKRTTMPAPPTVPAAADATVRVAAVQLKRTPR